MNTELLDLLHSLTKNLDFNIIKGDYIQLRMSMETYEKLWYEIHEVSINYNDVKYEIEDFALNGHKFKITLDTTISSIQITFEIGI